MKTVGFDKPLYILPFDHRGSFQSKMFGWKGTLTSEQTVQIAAGVSSGMEMSAPRFAAVRKALIDDGVAEDLIARSAIPDPKLDTGTARQRVEIRLLMKGP